MQPYAFSLCPDSHFAHQQFQNCTAQSKNSYFARQSENSHFAQDDSGIVPIVTLRRTYELKFNHIWSGLRRTGGHLETALEFPDG